MDSGFRRSLGTNGCHSNLAGSCRALHGLVRSAAEREAASRSTPQDACPVAAKIIPEEKLRWIASYEHLSEEYAGNANK